LFRNLSNQPTSYAAKRPRRGRASNTPRQKLISCCLLLIKTSIYLYLNGVRWKKLSWNLKSKILIFLDTTEQQGVVISAFRGNVSSTNLKFRGPYIVIYANTRNKSQRDALFLNFILGKNTTCFGQISCPSSGALILYSHQ